jgi:hemerythrin-like domain-containing protein
MRTHIQKEDRVVYPMADQIFSKADQRELARAFDRIEKQTMGADTHAKYQRLAHDLAGLPVPDKRSAHPRSARKD